MTSSWKHFGGKFEKFITFTLWQIGKLLVIAASDDVAADAVVSAMAFDLGLIAVEVLPGLVDDVSASLCTWASRTTRCRLTGR